MPAKFAACCLLLIALLAGAVGSALGAEAEQGPAPPAAPTVEAVCVEAPPTIDGDLDDPCWQETCCAREFWRTDKEAPASEPTEAYLCCDQAAIYVAFRCRDSQPDKIRAQEHRRDGAVWSDDRVTFMLDPDHDAKNFWEFTVTPLGTQADYVPGGSAAKIEWRGDWTAAARRTDDGWTCEMRVPFEILRYPRDATWFRVVFERWLARATERSTWPDLGTNWQLEKAANWVGLRPPLLKPPPLLMPYAIADLGEAPGKHLDLGLDLKHRHPLGLTTLATINPDYSQIEDVVSSIAFEFEEPYWRMPDTRPFFAEGSGAYYPYGRLFYSRYVGDIDLGLKTFGTVGRTDIGLLDAYKKDAINAAVASIGYHYDDLSTADLYLVDGRGPANPHNVLAAFDLNHRRRIGGDVRRYNLRHEYTYTADGRGEGTSFELATGRSRGRGHWSDNFQFRRTTAPYYAGLGVSREAGVRGGSAIWDRYDENVGGFESRYFEFHNAYFTDDKGEIFKRYHILYADFYWRNGRWLDLKATEGEREHYDLSDLSVSYGWRSHDLYRSGGFSGLVGNRLGGDYRELSFWQGFKPGKRLSASIWGEYARLTEPAPGAYSQYQVVLGTTYEFSPEKHASLRFIQRRDGPNLFASYRQRLRRGADVYVLVGDPNPAGTVIRQRLALKVIAAL